MKHTLTTFVFTPEHGARLRSLRTGRSLSLRDVALLMGRESKGAFNLLAKLERGELKHRSVNFAADTFNRWKPRLLSRLGKPSVIGRHLPS